MNALAKMSPIFFLAIIASSTTAEAQLNNNTFQLQINVPANEVRVDSLLRIFSRQTGVEFSFSSNKISPSKKITITKHRQTLSQWLSTLSSTLGVQHKVVGNHIILIDNEKHVGGKKITGTATAAGIGKNNLPPPAAKKEISENGMVEPAGKFIAVNENEIAETDSVRTPAETVSDTINPNLGVIVNLISLPIVQIGPLSVDAGVIPSGEKRNIPPIHSVQFVGGFCKHGSGDMNGYMMGGEYISYLSRKFSLTYNMRATINSQVHEIYVDNGGGSITDASIRFTTAGIQLGVDGGLSLVNSAKHEFMIKIGAFVRHQSASNGSDGYSLYYPIATGVPTVLVGYDNKTPQQTIAAGGILMLQYNFTFNNGLFLGLQPAFQTDTNGDAIAQGGLVFGKRF